MAIKKKNNQSWGRKRAAYWIGVGLSAGRDPELRRKLLESSACKSSVVAGYTADNYRDVGGKFAKSK